MRVLLTGATGFVGRALARELAGRQTDLTCVIRSGSAHRLPVPARTVETPDLFAQDADWWADTCAGADLVLHAAWYAEPGKYLTSPRNLDCLAGTLALAQGAARAEVRRLVGIGTCFEYDLSLGHLPVNTPLDPQTPYAAAKTATFLTLSRWLPQEGVSFLWARLFFLYGEGEDPRRLVPYLHRQLQAGQQAELTEGTQIRDYMEVREAARMIADDALGGVEGATNIASGKGRTVRALAEEIADIYGRRDLLEFGARPQNLTDPPVVVGLRAED